MSGISNEFKDAVQWAIAQAQQSPDELVRFAIHNLPIYAQPTPTPKQAQAGGCVTCTYLGLWADKWPGYQAMPHGTIWLFEQGIRSMGGDLRQRTLNTLLHEIDHALERDHVLEALNEQKAQAAAMVRPQYGCCR